MAAKSLEAKVIEARAKLAALRGDERADLPSGPERTAYNKELRRAAVVAKKLEAVFASPDYAPAENLPPVIHHVGASCLVMGFPPVRS